jgi:hypothetical protein
MPLAMPDWYVNHPVQRKCNTAKQSSVPDPLTAITDESDMIKMNSEQKEITPQTTHPVNIGFED